jgi:hypothetical protein
MAAEDTRRESSIPGVPVSPLIMSIAAEDEIMKKWIALI